MKMRNDKNISFQFVNAEEKEKEKIIILPAISPGHSGNYNNNNH